MSRGRRRRPTNSARSPNRDCGRRARGSPLSGINRLLEIERALEQISNRDIPETTVLLVVEAIEDSQLCVRKSAERLHSAQKLLGKSLEMSARAEDAVCRSVARLAQVKSTRDVDLT